MPVTLEPPKAPGQLLRSLDLVNIQSVSRLCVQDSIRPGINADGVHIAYVNPLFISCFGGVYEPGPVPVQLQPEELLTGMGDRDLPVILDSSELAICMQIWDFYALLKQQPSGDVKGPLLTDGNMNFGFAKDPDPKQGRILSVSACWKDGWHIHAALKAAAKHWYVNSRFFHPPLIGR